MASGDGPWTDENPPPRRGRGWLALAVFGASLVGLFLLARAFPGSLQTAEDKGWLIRGILLLAIVAAGLFSARRINWSEKARHAGIWLGIFVVLMLGVSYAPDLAGIGQKVRGSFLPAEPIQTTAQEMVVSQDASGGFFVMGKVNGQRVHFLIDTGASDTVLSPADAGRLGIDLKALKFDKSAETANGTGYGAVYQAERLSVGQIEIIDMPMVINQAPMSSSLLGMSFLSQLQSFRVEGGKMHLKSKDQPSDR